MTLDTNGDTPQETHRRVEDVRPNDGAADGTNRGNAVYLLFAILTLAALIRFWGLGRQDFWLDEIHSLVASAGQRAEWEAQPHGALIGSMRSFAQLTPQSDLSAVWRTMAEDSHPPLYFLLHHLWRRVFGDSEFAVRSLPALLSVLSLAALFLIFQEAARPEAGLVAAAIATLSFSHIFMAQENRPYSLGMLLISISYWLFVRMERRWNRLTSTGRVTILCGYGLSLLAAPITHYFTALALAGQGAYALLRFRGRLLSAWCVTASLAAITWGLIWGPTFVAQWDFIISQNWLLDDSSDRVLRTLKRFLDAPFRLLIPHEPFQSFWTQSLVGVAGATLLLIAVRRRDALLSLMLLWILIPVAAFAAFDLVAGRQLLSHLRYPSVAVGGLCGLVALGVGQLRPNVRWIVPLVLCASQAILLIGHVPPAKNPASRLAASRVREVLRDADLLLFDAVDWPDFWASQLCIQVTYYMPPFSNPVMMLRSVPSVETRELIRGFSRVVCVAVPERRTSPPLPNEFRMIARSEYIDQIGFVEVWERGDLQSGLVGEASDVAPAVGSREKR